MAFAQAMSPATQEMKLDEVTAALWSNLAALHFPQLLPISMPARGTQWGGGQGGRESLSFKLINQNTKLP